jgi:hypothetical protein
MNSTLVTIELYAGRKLHEFYNPQKWDTFWEVVKHLKYADTVHLKCYIGIMQMMELSDFIKCIIDLECDSVEFEILEKEQNPALLYERFESHVRGEMECAKLVIKNFTNKRYQCFNETKLLNTYNNNTWDDVVALKNLIIRLEELFQQPVQDSAKNWKKFTSQLVDKIDTKNINDYLSSYKLVGGEIYSNV